jgi:hypothetical protein
MKDGMMLNHHSYKTLEFPPRPHRVPHEKEPKHLRNQGDQNIEPTVEVIPFIFFNIRLKLKI